MAYGKAPEEIDFTSYAIRREMKAGKTFAQAVNDLHAEAQQAFDEAMDRYYGMDVSCNADPGDEQPEVSP